MWFRREQSTGDESQKALKESTRSLKQTELRTVEVTAVSEALRTLRERNHFAEELESIMGGPR
jgi:hypothetical protein